MNEHRDPVDAYAETHVLPQKQRFDGAPSRDTDPLALYEEYARQQQSDAAAAGAAAKRAKR